MIGYIGAVLGGLVWGVFTYHYAEWKVIIGPEEEDKEGQKGLDLLRDRVQRGERKRLERPGLAGIGYIVCNIALWCLFLTLEGFSVRYLLYALTASLLCSLSYVDIKIQELPPEENLLIAILGVVQLFLDLPHWWEYLIGAVCVSGLFLIVGLISSGGAMGLGDVKLMAALGLLLGWKRILLVMFLGCVLGTLIHIPLMALLKKGRQLAFGPYLAAAAILVMGWGEPILEWYLGVIAIGK